MSWVECPTLNYALEASPRERAAAIPESLATPARALLGAVRAGIPKRYRILADVARVRTWNRFHGEMCGFAERLGVDWRDLALANLSYDLLIASLGCSTMALATPAGPVLARNMDWVPESLLARASALCRWHRADSAAFAAAGWPGAIGVVSGLSTRGFGLVLNAVTCRERVNVRGYPMLLFLRRVIEDARNFREALAWLRDTPLASPGLITLVGTTNDERAVIERTPRRAMVRLPDGLAPLVTTNDYQAFKEAAREAVAGPMGGTSSCSRLEALRCATRNETGTREIHDDELLFWLSDPQVMQTITAQHVILRPAAGTLRLFVPGRLLKSAG